MGPAISLSPLEIASGLVFGADPGAQAWPDLPAGVGPREAFEQVVLEALHHPPCLVTFSGGRDSSAVLAVAAHLARRDGLDPPIPVTCVFPDLPETDEGEWQEGVIAHIGVADWRRLELTDELDLVGQVAGEALRRHGVLYPANAHFHVPPLREARGGSLLTGWGGDQAFDCWGPQRPVLALTRRVRPQTADLRRVAFWSLPAALRRRVLRLRARLGLDWLTERGRSLATAAWADDYASDPRTWARHLHVMTRQRDMTLCHRSFELLARDESVFIRHPFADNRFLAALSRLQPRVGPGDRTAAMRRLFGDLLPDPLITRSSKASFGDVFFNRPTREFTAAFAGEGIDTDLVDPRALRERWRSPRSGLHTALLIQDLWLRDVLRSGRQ